MASPLQRQAVSLIAIELRNSSSPLVSCAFAIDSFAMLGFLDWASLLTSLCSSGRDSDFRRLTRDSWRLADGTLVQIIGTTCGEGTSEQQDNYAFVNSD